MRVLRSLQLAGVLTSASCATEPPALQPSGVAKEGGAGTGGVNGSVGLVLAGSDAIGGLGTGVQPTAVALGAECDPSRSIASDGATLVIRDPEVLERFGLERVLRQVVTTAEADTEIEPLELLQRLFDTDNADQGGAFADGLHCDSPLNPAFVGSRAVDCPRAEGRLAFSADLLSTDAADGFEPVAIINRFDLLPSNLSSCGEQRIVYAKRSGRSDPEDARF